MQKYDTHIRVSRDLYFALKQYIRDKNLKKGAISDLIEKALSIYLGIEKDKNEKLFNEIENLRKENEFLKEEIEKLKEHLFKINEDHVEKNEILNLKYELDLLRREIYILREKANKVEENIPAVSIKKTETIIEKRNIPIKGNLPSFLKDNPWIEILQKRTKEENI